MVCKYQGTLSINKDRNYCNVFAVYFLLMWLCSYALVSHTVVVVGTQQIDKDL